MQDLTYTEDAPPLSDEELVAFLDYMVSELDDKRVGILLHYLSGNRSNG